MVGVAKSAAANEFQSAEMSVVAVPVNCDSRRPAADDDAQYEGIVSTEAREGCLQHVLGRRADLKFHTVRVVPFRDDTFQAFLGDNLSDHRGLSHEAEQIDFLEPL